MARWPEDWSEDPGAYVRRRSRLVAHVCLTRRDEVSIWWYEAGLSERFDGRVFVTTGDARFKQEFHVRVTGTLRPDSPGRDRRRIARALQGLVGRRRLPFPVMLIDVTMIGDACRYAWAAEPVIRAGRAALSYHPDATPRPLDRPAQCEIIEQLRVWFRAMPDSGGNRSCGRCRSILYLETEAGRRPCPVCGSMLRTFLERTRGPTMQFGGMARVE